MSRGRRALIAACLLASLAQSLFFVYAEVPDNEEEMYMFLGRSALTGEISLFQDELVGNRLPFVYYFVGLSQLLWPGSLVAARLLSALLGLLCLLLVLRIATRLGGELAGILATLFAVTHSLTIGYFATASYHSLVSFLLLAALYVLLCTTLPYRRLIAMTLVSALFFTRTNMAPLIPPMLAYLFWTSDSVRERAALAAVTVVPAAAFLLSDPNHLKLLAYVPVLRRLVQPLGFGFDAAAFAFFYGPERAQSFASALVLLARWYRVWGVATVGLLAVVVVRLARGLPVRRLFSNRRVNLLVAVTLYLVLSQGALVWNFRFAVGYSPSFSFLAAACLGCWYAVALEDLLRPAGRRAALLLLSGLFLVAPAQSRPPILPLAVSYRYPPTTALYALADALSARIPKGSKVFRFGPPLGLYVAGLKPYLRQERDVFTLSSLADKAFLRRNGLWGDSDIRHWLGADADYAVIAPAALDAYRSSPVGRNVELIEALLGRHFVRIAVTDQYPGHIYYVYRRTSAAN